MANVKPHVDMIYVIPSTDPMPYIQMMVSPQDVEAGLCCYARGDDMLQFPGREVRRVRGAKQQFFRI